MIINSRIEEIDKARALEQEGHGQERPDEEAGDLGSQQEPERNVVRKSPSPADERGED